MYTAENKKVLLLHLIMPDNKKPALPLKLDTFGGMLRYLRKRAQLTQRELAIAVGYSEAHISRLETNERPPDLSALAALFVPALGLEEEPELIAEFLELASGTRRGDLALKGRLTLVQSIEQDVTQTLESLPVPSNLPIQLTSFIGREKEIEEIHDLLLGKSNIRMLTLVGAGGCGKTRLALQVVEGLVIDFPQGVWFVDLAPLADPELIPAITANLLGLPGSSPTQLLKDLPALLYSKRMIILFDNCEHVLAGVSSFVETLLRACPQLRVVATSREALNIPGERRFLVSPLPYPGDVSSDTFTIGNFASVRLFVQRARNVEPSFQLTDANAPWVARVCRRLDGIPLAIELAAARVGLLRVPEIEAQLKDRFQLLTGGGRTLPRHQTLRAMIDWSHNLLSEEERTLFRRLAIFAGGWTLAAASSLAIQSSEVSILDLFARLVNKSFITVERTQGQQARYSMLETLREYALEKLEYAGETSYALEQQFEFFHRLALNARLYGPDKQNWLDRLEADYDNIRTVVNWALTYGESAGVQPYIEEAAELVLALVDFFWFRGFMLEAREWMDQLLAIAMPDSSLRALLLQKSGWFARASGDFERAERLLERALEMSIAIGDKVRASWALGDLGLCARDQGHYDQAISYFSGQLLLARETGELRSVGNSMYVLAESYAEDLERSRALWEEGLQIHRASGDPTHIAWGLEGLAGVSLLSGDSASASKFHLESLQIKAEVMDKLGIAHSLEGLAQVAAADEEPERAAVLWGAADSLRKAMHTPSDPSRAGFYTSLMPRAREQLGEKLFHEYWERGQRMEVREAIEYALQLR